MRQGRGGQRSKKCEYAAVDSSQTVFTVTEIIARLRVVYKLYE